MEKLDYEQPYGIIYGHPGLGFEQNGVHFGPNGELIERWSTLEKISGERVQALKRKAKEQALAVKREEREKRRKLLEEL